MAVYPAFTAEEKALRKRYARLQDKRKQLRQRSEKLAQTAASSAASAKQAQKDVRNPKEAKEAARRLLESGKLTIKPRSPLKRTGFKRVGEVTGKAPPAKKANTSTAATTPQEPAKPKIKAADVQKLYSRFVKSTKPDDLERIPRKQDVPEDTPPVPAQQFSTKECTVCVRCRDAGEEALRTAFSRFGGIQNLSLSGSSSFITFLNPQVASTVRKEMDKGMIHGCDVYVDFASAENGFFELPPEAASEPWAQIAAGRELEGGAGPSKRAEAGRAKHKEVVSYEADF